jgi:hypothetical protein
MAMTPQAQAAWEALDAGIAARYVMERQTGGPSKYGKSSLRYHRAGKTLATLFEQEEGFHLLIILGAKEREKFEANRARFSAEIAAQVDAASTYHDGKWIYFPVCDAANLPDFFALLALKRRPQALL